MSLLNLSSSVVYLWLPKFKKMNKIFSFESDFVDSLRCIPMQVRLKLDTCGVKLKLDHWHKFSHEERLSLLTLSCETEQDTINFRQYLQSLVQQKTGVTAKNNRDGFITCLAK